MFLIFLAKSMRRILADPFLYTENQEMTNTEEKNIWYYYEGQTKLNIMEKKHLVQVITQHIVLHL